MYARIKTIIAEARLESGGGGGYDNSSGGGSSPASPGASESDGSSSADEFYPPDLITSEFPRHASPLSSSARDEFDFDRDCVRQFFVSSPRVLDDVHTHQQRTLLLLLPAFASPADAASQADALSHWLSGLDIAWVLDMGASGRGGGALPRRELGSRVSAWAQALGTMERLFRRLRHRELEPAQAAALGELAAASSGAMLGLAGAVAVLGSSPSTLLAALDLYAPLSETYPVLAVLFSWGPFHPVPAAAGAALAGLVETARRGGRDLGAFVRSHCTWQMPQGGEVHPCVGFWMGYLRCMLRRRVSLHLVLGGDDGESPATPLAPGAEGIHRLVAELVSCLEAALEEKAAALASPGLRQVFMLNNTHAVVRRAAGSDLRHFLPSDWLRVREERIEGLIRGYMDASWVPVVSRLDSGGGRTKQPARRRRPLIAFYTAFENACSAQRCWNVPNPALRGVLRNTVSEYVVPAYRRYLDDHPEVEAAPGHTAEELEEQLSDLFEG